MIGWFLFNFVASTKKNYSFLTSNYCGIKTMKSWKGKLSIVATRIKMINTWNQGVSINVWYLLCFFSSQGILSSFFTQSLDRKHFLWTKQVENILQISHFEILYIIKIKDLWHLVAIEIPIDNVIMSNEIVKDWNGSIVQYRSCLKMII